MISIVCSKRGRCEAFQDGRHPETAQRQGSRHWPGQTREQLYSLPPRLCREIAESLNGKGEALPPPPNTPRNSHATRSSPACRAPASSWGRANPGRRWR